MQCPNCNSSLQQITYEGVIIETCPSCEGEWLDADELGKIIKRQQVTFNVEERKRVAEAVKITCVELEDVDRDLVCPKCGQTTNPINYGGDTGIIIDRCTGCKGFWLDRDELEKIQMVIEGWSDLLPDDIAEHASEEWRRVSGDRPEYPPQPEQPGQPARRFPTFARWLGLG